MNKIADHIYVIHLKSRAPRLEAFKSRFQTIFENIDMNVEVFEGVDPSQCKHADDFAQWQRRHKLDGAFHAGQYLKNNPDLRLKGIRTAAAATHHWHQCGQAEGRCWGSETDMMRPGQWGCLRSHTEVIRDALCKGYESILVLEDDAAPISSELFFQGLRVAKAHITTHPDWSVLYLGAAQNDWAHIPPNELAAGMYRARTTRGTFAYLVHRPFMQRLLDEFAMETHSSDGCLRRLQQAHAFPVLFPNIVWCQLEDSDTGPGRDTSEWAAQFRWVIVTTNPNQDSDV